MPRKIAFAFIALVVFALSASAQPVPYQVVEIETREWMKRILGQS